MEIFDNWNVYNEQSDKIKSIIQGTVEMLADSNPKVVQNNWKLVILITNFKQRDNFMLKCRKVFNLFIPALIYYNI